MLHYIWPEELVKEKRDSVLSPFVDYVENLLLMNGPNKIECYITLCQNSFPGINAQTYWSHFLLTSPGVKVVV